MYIARFLDDSFVNSGHSQGSGLVMWIARFLGDSFGNSDYSFGSRPEMRIARFVDATALGTTATAIGAALRCESRRCAETIF